MATAPLWLIRKSLTSDGCVTKAIYEFSTHAGYSALTPQVHLHGRSFVSLIELFQREIVLFCSVYLPQSNQIGAVGGAGGGGHT